MGVHSQVWQLQEAKNKLSQVINQAQEHSPQIITRHGEPVAYILSPQDYHQQCHSVKDVLARFPYRKTGLEISRDPDTGREIEL
jgi:prevent-host-death family protein